MSLFMLYILDVILRIMIKQEDDLYIKIIIDVKCIFYNDFI